MVAMKTLKRLVIANIVWNSIFILMMCSELAGITNIHETLPWWLKWIWGISLAFGNAFIHTWQWLVLRRYELPYSARYADPYPKFTESGGRGGGSI